jgi:Uma2 family endonuclease
MRHLEEPPDSWSGGIFLLDTEGCRWTEVHPLVLRDHPGPFTPEQFLVWERQQPQKYEYRSGSISLMAGGSKAHNLIAVNITAALHAHLLDRPCRVFNSDQMVACSEAGPFYYPEISVSCDPREEETGYLLRYPCLIVEVLSKNTADFDRTVKFRDYATVSTLQEYVLFDSQSAAGSLFRRQNGNLWQVQIFAESDVIDLQSLSLQLPVHRAYAKVVFDAKG